MLLIESAMFLPSKLMKRAAWAALLLLCSSSHAHGQEKECVVQFSVYDPVGASLDFHITRVSPPSDAKENVLSKEPRVMTTRANLLLFSDRRFLGRTLDVLLEGPNGAQITTRTVLTACRLRRSLFFGKSDLGPDVNGIAVSGRLSGCQFAGDWWVRAVTMFGGHEGSADYAVDGYVESDGSFTLVLGPLGVRRLLVVGHGKEALKVTAVDVTQGKSSNVGVIDLKDSCPK